MCARASLVLTFALMLGRLPTALAALQRRCTEVAEGRTEGVVVALEPLVLPRAERRQEVHLPVRETCDGEVCRCSGVVVTACDVLPPQLELQVEEGAGAVNEGRALVLRLGPLISPLLFEITFFCDVPPADRFALH